MHIKSTCSMGIIWIPRITLLPACCVRHHIWTNSTRSFTCPTIRSKVFSGRAAMAIFAIAKIKNRLSIAATSVPNTNFVIGYLIAIAIAPSDSLTTTPAIPRTCWALCDFTCGVDLTISKANLKKHIFQSDMQSWNEFIYQNMERFRWFR